MKRIRQPMFVFWGVVSLAGAAWVRFGIGSESWTSWMMAGLGVVFLAVGLTWRPRAVD